MGASEINENGCGRRYFQNCFYCWENQRPVYKAIQVHTIRNQCGQNQKPHFLTENSEVSLLHLQLED